MFVQVHQYDFDCNGLHICLPTDASTLYNFIGSKQKNCVLSLYLQQNDTETCLIEAWLIKTCLFKKKRKIGTYIVVQVV